VLFANTLTKFMEMLFGTGSVLLCVKYYVVVQLQDIREDIL
jgi:hypothetical protein